MRHTTLISASELAHHALEPDWVVVDCRHDLALPDAGRLAYEAGHIPGAQFAHLDRDLSGAKTGAQGNFLGRHPLPERAAFVETLRRWGINNKSQVVAYDGQGGMFAARLWWLLRWAGHDSVAVLDGGVQAWSASGMWLSAELRGKPHGDFIAQAPLVATVDAAALLDNLQQQARTVIDARAPDRFRGENETIDPVGGHIPGAKNRFFKDNLQADGRFKPAAQLRDEWQSVIASPQAAVMQCGSGVTACHNLLALEVAGLPGAALYPGSWSEWCADPARPGRWRRDQDKNRMIGFAFCHGWSFDAQAFAPLRQALLQRLPDAALATFDLGFYRAPQSPPLAQDITWIALGHSYGFAWLLQQPQSWHAAISINGFTRFCRRPGLPEGTPVRLLQAMQARLESDAPATVQEFQARCGMPAVASMDLDQAALQEHLGRLRDLDLALPDCPVLALATRDDAIVPPALTHACFARTGCTLQEFNGDHMALLREPATAAAAIAAFTRNLHA